MPNEQQKQVLKLWKEKKAEFERELAITSNPSLKFELKQRILECEQELGRLNNAYKSENQALKVSDINPKHMDLEQKAEDVDISPDEWFSKRKSRFGNFLKSIFEDI
ncbi:MAG: hypothetical protein AAFY63_15305 [Cyanobacteria bacterium J06643_13]